MDPNKKKKLICALFLATAVILLFFAATIGTASTPGGVTLDGGDTTSQEEIQAMLDARAQEAGVTVSINSNIFAETGSSDANLFISNPESNEDAWRVALFREDTGECIYESDDVPPGGSVDSARLQVALEKGSYPCTAEFHVLGADGIDKSVINIKVNVTILR